MKLRLNTPFTLLASNGIFFMLVVMATIHTYASRYGGNT